MKTITISDESFEFLENFIKTINTQDADTTFPYVYAVRDIKRVYGIDPESEYDNDGSVWVDADDQEISVDDMIDFLVEYELITESYIPKFKKNLADLDEYSDFTRVYYKDIRVIKNVFFTAEQAKEHIIHSSYQFRDPDIYVIHLFRNEEMVNLVEAIENIVNKEEV